MSTTQLERGVTIGSIATEPVNGHSVGASRAAAVEQLTMEQAVTYLQSAHLGDYSAGYERGYQAGLRAAELSLAEMWRAIEAAKQARADKVRGEKK